jgi:aminopeptidase N
VTRARPVARAVALVAAALLALGACSGGDVLSGAATTSTPDAATPTTAAAPSTTSGADANARAGEPGAGDPYFPLLGNGGYDVARYELDLDVHGDAVTADVTIEATATADLDSFDLDFAPFTIDDLRVDGAPAPYRFDLAADEGAGAAGELVVDPDPVLEAGSDFVVEIRYHGVPRSEPNPVLGTLGWQRVGDVTFVSDEPDGAHTWFPANDHPSDKAAFRFRITAPSDVVVVASGVLASKEQHDGTTTWVWDHPEPMATYVAALAIGPLTVVESDGPHGIHIRHAFAPSLAAVATPAFADTAQMITDLEAMFGPYPFDSYGALVVDGNLGYAMENQTLTLFDRTIVDGSFESSKTMVHELAHHWFGNWVSPATWQDTWLNEGFATYAEQLWLEHTIAGYDIDGAMRTMARRPYAAIGDPGPGSMFSGAVYTRGALTLHALRRTMGDAGFFQLLRAWCDRFGGSTASTADLADLASEVAGTDLHPLVEAWVASPVMPRLPG